MNTETLLPEKSSWLDRPLFELTKLDYEKALYLLFILAAIFTRFYGLGDRAMSHDESLHTYYSWNLYAGRGFAHTPLMHGPFLFHVNALIYALFGASDFTARISVALFGVALVALPWTLRRWMGRAGALATSFMLLISPYIWYHARYIRNESYVTVWALLTVLAIFAYLRKQDNRWLYLFAAVSALHLATKEVSFIYTAIFGSFLIGLFFWQMIRSAKFGLEGLAGMLAGAGGGAVILLVGLGIQWWLLRLIGVGVSNVIAQDGIPTAASGPALSMLMIVVYLIIIGGLIGAAAGLAVYFMLRFLMPEVKRITGEAERPVLDLVMVLGTLYLPTLSPFAMRLLQIDPMDYNNAGVIRAGSIFVLFLGVSIGIGIWWDWKRWLISASLWYGIGLTLFTTLFTNGAGIGTGFIGSLGYWLAQQGVVRGNQPVYYYFIVTPLYEYFPILVSLIAAFYYVIRARGLPVTLPDTSANSETPAPNLASKGMFVAFSIYWIATTWVIYSYAGEKMPWLSVHLALPMIVLSGLFLGQVIESVDWRSLGLAWLTVVMAPLLLIGLAALFTAMSSGAFRGNEVNNMVATGQWISGLLAIIGAGAAMVFIALRVGVKKCAQVAGLALAAALALATFRAGWRWNFINYDYPIEYGVYAHGGNGIKLALRQIEEIADRTVGRSALKVAYDSDSSWPYTWYLRDYPNQAFFGSAPTRESLDAPAVLAGSASWNTVEPILGKRYDEFTYRLIWWPMEDYKVFADCPAQKVEPDGTLVRVAAYDENADGAIDQAEKQRGSSRCSRYSLQNNPKILWEWISNADRRQAIWDIFWNRDYRKYDQVTGKTHTIEQWPLVHDFKLYVRKDVAAQVWDMGVSPTAREPYQDPYAKGQRDVAASQVLGPQGSGPGEFAMPHGLAVAPDGSLYVADSNNHRIQKFSPEGKLILSFGSFGQAMATAAAPPGTFNEPWGIAVGPDGSVYVADTWNHRIQKFTADGKFIKQWGEAGQTNGALSNDPALNYVLWGPRGVAVDAQGNVYVTDTGDKRVMVFDSEGKYLRQFGGVGVLPGQLDEPVGIAISPEGNVVVADTWNLRVQVLSPQGAPIFSWPIDGWIGQAVTNKPYLAVDKNGYTYVSDPTGFRVLVFAPEGTFVATFGDVGTDNKGFQLPIGVAVDQEGNVYVSDADTGRVLKFPPLDPGSAPSQNP